MKKQLLTLMLIAFLCNGSFAFNKAINTYSSGYGATSTYPLTGVCAFTLETWFNGSSGTTYARLISFSNYAFEIAGGGGTISIYDGSWRATGVTGMGSGWHHVAVTNDLTNFVVYVDGVQVYTKASVARDFTGQVMNIGHDAKVHTANQRFPGKFDEVRVWNRALSAIEIAIVKTKQALGTESGLVVYYDFNDGTGTNKVSNTHHLTLASSPAIITTNFIDYIKDWGMSYDGTDDRTYLATPITGNNNFTFETQFKTTSTNPSTHSRFISFPSYLCEVAIVNGVIQSYMGSGTWVACSGSGFNDGQWHHLGVTKNGTAVTIYVDGVVVGTRSATLNLSSNMYFGGTSVSTDYFVGTLDEIRIWNIVRTKDEIGLNFNTELAGNETGLVAYWDFNTATGATNISNMVNSGTALTRAGAGGSNNYPQFVDATKNEIATSTNEILSANESVLTVYPNPFTSVITLNIPSVNKVVVMDAAGKAVFSVNNSGSQIDLSSLNAGTYFMNVYSDQAVQTAIVVKQQ
ncbi:MAG: T9SS type A sorting domain-containing protein [Bacteroidetes bacterium]|nr:T9SS type A sorting domain-containing protein [Bacteroidota bacterium]